MFLDGSMRYDFSGRLLFDPHTAKGFEIEGEAIHRLSPRVLLSTDGAKFISKTDKRILREHLSDLLDGFYVKNPNNWSVTEGIKSRVVYSRNMSSRTYVTWDLDTLVDNPLGHEYYTYKFKRECKSRELGWPDKNDNIKMKDLTEGQRVAVQELAAVEIAKLESHLAKTNQVIAALGKARKYIVITETGSVLEPEKGF
jgi:hypothetical protein